MSERLITPEFRVSYASVFAAKKNELSGKDEYSLVAIFPKGTDLTPLKKAAHEAGVKKWGADQSKWPSNLRSPFRKCNERWKNENGGQFIPPGYEDGEAVFLSLKSANKPGVVDARVQDIIEQREFYSGCFAKASVNAYAYDNKGNRGISFGLNNVQKLRDGDPLGGRSRPTDDFEAADVGTGAAASGGGGASMFD